MDQEAYYGKKESAAKYVQSFVWRQRVGLESERDLREGLTDVEADFCNAVGGVLDARSQRTVCAHEADLHGDKVYALSSGAYIEFAGSYHQLSQDLRPMLDKPPKADASKMTPRQRMHAGQVLVDGALDHCFAPFKVRCGDMELPILGVGLNSNFAAESEKAVQQAQEWRMENPTIAAPTAVRSNAPAPRQHQGRAM
ncbi:hypothetical protein RFF05_12330 [Bengtsoniella intestinalis]|uniref:hypothetical protein n=1 Tax=Bengtsoniella intestinalis TaxID=3073143 RepID=UPI00391FBB4D